MGILNINDDSFYKNSRTNDGQFLTKAYEILSDGADILDVGAVSSRPGAICISEVEEFTNLKPIIDICYKHKLYELLNLSIDSYSPLVLEYALDHGFTMINDITGLNNDKVASLAASFQATICVMHMQGGPGSMNLNPQYDNVILELDTFFHDRIEKAKQFGIKKIILDVGISFGKSLEHNLQLIKHQGHFLKFGLPLLIGASRKGFLSKIIKSKVEDRLAETLAIHIKALQEGASILRVHDVRAHHKALEVLKALEKY